MPPSGVLAGSIAIFASVALENHLKPLITHGPRFMPSISLYLPAGSVLQPRGQ